MIGLDGNATAVSTIQYRPEPNCVKWAPCSGSELSALSRLGPWVVVLAFGFRYLTFGLRALRAALSTDYCLPSSEE